MLDEDNESFFHFKRNVKNKESDTLSIKFASIIFDNIKDYGILHSGDVISQAVAKSIKQDVNVPGIFEFLNARFKILNHCPDKKGTIKENLLTEI